MASETEEQFNEFRRSVPLSRLSLFEVESTLLKRVSDFDLAHFREGVGQNVELKSLPLSTSYDSVWDYWRHLAFQNKYLDPVNVSVAFYNRSQDKEEAWKIVGTFIHELSEYYAIQDVDTHSSMKTIIANYNNRSPLEYFNYVRIPSELIQRVRDDDRYSTYESVLNWCVLSIVDSWFNQYDEESKKMYTDAVLYYINEVEDNEDNESLAPYLSEKVVLDAVFTIRVWSLSLMERIISDDDDVESLLVDLRRIQDARNDEDFSGEILEDKLQQLQLSVGSYGVAKSELHHYKDFPNMMEARQAYAIFRDDSLIDDPSGSSRSDIIEKKYTMRRLRALAWLYLAEYDSHYIKEIIESESINVTLDKVVGVSKQIDRQIKSRPDLRSLVDYLLRKRYLDKIDSLGFAIEFESEIDVTDTNVLNLGVNGKSDVVITDFYFTSMKIHYRMDIEDTVDLFRRTDTNINVPFILVKDGKDTRIKVFSKSESSNLHNIDRISSQIINDPDIHKGRDFISFSVWLKEEFRASKDSNLQEFNRAYTYVKMWPKSGEIEINVSSIYLDRVMKRIIETFDIKIRGIKWQSSLGSFYVIGSDFENHVGFANTIRNNPMYHYFLNDSEVDKIKASTSRIKMTYTQPAVTRYYSVPSTIDPSDVIIKDSSRMVHLTMSSSTLSKDETVMIDGNKWRIPDTTKVFQISVSKISNQETVSSLRGVFIRLWKRWLKEGSPLAEAMWSSLFGGRANWSISGSSVENIKIPKLTLSRKLHNTRTTLVVLQSISRKLFGGEYTMRCPKQKQPHVITEEEHKRIDQEKLWLSPEGIDIKIDPVDVLEFRLKGSQTIHRMICPYNSYRHPTLMVNRDPKSVKVHNCIPCCESERSDLVKLQNMCNQNMFEWRPSLPKVGNPVYQEETIAATESINRILGFNGVIVGVGLPEWYTRSVNPNIMIQAVLEAVRDRKYMKKKAEISKKAEEQDLKRVDIDGELRGYIQTLRMAMASYIEKEISGHKMTGLLKQELYSHDDEDIVDLLMSEEMFDSKYLYRILEVIMGVNIFVIVYDNNSKTYQFEVPNCKSNHIRMLRDMLPSIVLVRHDGYRGRSHYSYIRAAVNYDGNTVFGFEETTKLFKNYMEMNAITTIRVDDYQQHLSIYKNVYPSYDTFKRLGSEMFVRGQYIDENGQATGFILGLREWQPIGSDIKNVLIISVPPTQPENVPVVEDMHKFMISAVESGGLKSVQAVTSILGVKPIAKSNNGVWMSLESRNDQDKLHSVARSTIHVVCDIKNSDLPIGPPSPIQSPLNFKRNTRLKTLRSTQKIVVGLIDHSYAIYAQGNRNHNYGEFMNSYMLVGPSDSGATEDSVNEYIPISTNMNIQLGSPENTDVNTSIQDAGAYVQGLVIESNTGPRYRLYNERFMMNIAYHLKKKFSMVLVPDVPTMIVLEEENVVSRNSTVFDVVSDFKVWMKSRVKYDQWVSSFALRNTIPIPYSPEPGVYYIIQPTISKEIAVMIAAHWWYRKRNIGEKSAIELLQTCGQGEVDAIVNSIFRVKLYTLDANDLTLMFDSKRVDATGVDTRALIEIVSPSSSNGKWGAILPLATL